MPSKQIVSISITNTISIDTINTLISNDLYIESITDFDRTSVY